MQDTAKISYIQLMNAFWQVNKTASFSSNDMAVYFYILDINNSCFWKENFTHNNRAIQGTLNISFNTLAKSRENLRKAGLIKFQTQNGSPNVIYQISTSHLTSLPTLSNNEKVTDEIKKSRERVDNIKDGVVNFDDYREFLNDEISIDARKSIYTLFSLRKGTLETLFNTFELAQKSTGLKTYPKIKNIHDHFFNWLNKQEELGKLKEYKNHSLKNKGSL